MINKVHIQNEATLRDLIFEPYQINYVFGGNGSGKTTISRFLANPQNYENGSIERTDSCEVLVYNKDFIDKNFQDKNAIQGIFTIGESAVETLQAIENLEEEKKSFQKEYEGRVRSIESLQTEINSLYATFESDCWKTQQEIGETFAKCLAGARGKRQIFADRCLKSYKDTESTLEYDDLLSTYQQVYQSSIQEYSLLKECSFAFKDETAEITLETIELNDIFFKKLVKSNESNFSTLIDSLGNVDWVSQGLKWLKQTVLCPFCQRKMTEDVLLELNHLFDETYNTSLEQLNLLSLKYGQIISCCKEHHSAIISLTQEIEFLNISDIQEKYNALLSLLTENKKKIDEKLSHPSIEVFLASSKELQRQYNDEIRKLNEQISKNNSIVKDLKKAKAKLSEDIWNYIANKRLHPVIVQYKKELSGKNKGMNSLLMARDSFKEKINLKNQEIQEKRASVVCIDNAVNEINTLLEGFGFKGFKIEKKDDISYRLIRADSSEVKETLSEGEHRFITFLYYYQLVKGTLQRDTVNKDKILVIDDPISSLDSNILFIVSFLVRELIKGCLDGSNVKQIIVLTHNIYFHQEIAFKGSRDNTSPLKERFHILRKINEETIIQSFEKNQINSSYELLWRELKNSNTDGAFICNTMRRILEHYFNVIGHKNYDTIIDSFEGQDKLICKTLLPFINTGSHTINDDFHLSIDADMISKYKEIFKAIFQKANQESHYNMMMEID